MKQQHLAFTTHSMVCLILFTCPVGATKLSFDSPDARIQTSISLDANGQLQYRVTKAGKPVLESSELGVLLGDQNVGQGVKLGPPIRRKVRNTYPRYGVKDQALNHCIAYVIPITHLSSQRKWTLELRIFNDGVAYRYRIPATGPQQVKGEASTWQLPPRSLLWYQPNTSNYEGVYERSKPADIPLVIKGRRGKSPTTQLGCPVTVELPGGGYALISEAALYNYSGMTLEPTGTQVLKATFEDDPQGFTVEGPIVSPWRVTLITDTLNELVNSDLIYNLCEPPDPQLFPQGVQSDWIRPGKGLITWCVFGNDGAQWYRQKWFVDMCAALNCEYLLVDGGWRSEKWGWLKDGGDLWSRLDELCRYAAERKVDIFVWHAYPEGREDGPGLTDPKKRRAFLRKCKDAGVKGVKIDFFDSESKEIIDVYEAILRETAELQLMVNFHGANKPTGEVRTWPHEITREGIREQEYLLWDKLPLHHYAALPFTRMVAGFGDFLPTYVRPKYLKNTRAVFQLATAVIFTSPFICWPDHPEPYLESPFLPLIRTMPPVWDETRVLPGSKLGESVVFARRSGKDWYVAILNCTKYSREFPLTFDFLSNGDYQAVWYYDDPETRSSLLMRAGKIIQNDYSFTLTVPSGGGFVARLSKPKEYTK